MHSKVGLQNIVQDLLLRSYARHYFIYLGNDGTKEGSSTEEQEDTEDLQEKLDRTCSGKKAAATALAPGTLHATQNSLNTPARLAWWHKYLL